MSADQQTVIHGDKAQQLLESIAEWGNVTTIIIHAGSVFEFKGPFPRGSNAEGYYNLKGAGTGAAAGFEGHLKLADIRDVSLISTDFAASPHAKGALGIIGPTRMDYGKLVPLLRFTAASLAGEVVPDEALDEA